MEIRQYKTSDCKEILQLFFNTVHTINARDYTEKQLAVWATGNEDIENWNQSFLNHFTIIAVERKEVVGFGDIDMTGYLDRLYVHQAYQRKGIATAICDILEVSVSVDKIKTHASLTSKNFFIKRGYRVLRPQEVERDGILLINYVMEKQR